MSLALWHWHIEISSKCTLKCSRCARQEVPESLVNTELGLDFFKKNFTPKFIKEHVEKITFCGDDGDPIYAHDLIDVIAYFKSIKNVSIIIVTNGSYKKEEWWEELAGILTDTDQIHFSLDGWDHESNIKYRVNSDWDSIITGIKTVRQFSNCWLIWDAIGFKFNESHINTMIELAKELQFDSFQLTKSTKFGKIYSSYGDNDPLQPSDNLISSTHRFEREVINLSEREFKVPWRIINLKHFSNVRQVDDIIPLCHIGNKGLFINSKGEFYPCCWVANRYTHNKHWSNIAQQYNLNDRLLYKVLVDEFWNKEFIKDSYECTLKCSKSCVTKNYATEW